MPILLVDNLFLIIQWVKKFQRGLLLRTPRIFDEGACFDAPLVRRGFHPGTAQRVLDRHCLANLRDSPEVSLQMRDVDRPLRRFRSLNYVFPRLSEDRPFGPPARYRLNQ